MTKIAAVAAWVGVLLVYILTCSQVLGPADSPEFAALMVHGGFAHAPGSPTTVLLYSMFSWIPLNPLFVASAATAIFGGAAIGLLYLACRAWGIDRNASAAAMVLVGLHSEVWLVHTHPEAFAVNHLFAAAILLFVAPDGPLRGARRVAVLGLLAGVGLGAHQTLVLLAPVGIWGVWIGAREAKRPSVAVGGGALLFALGCSIYGTMVLWDSPVSFGRIENVSEFVHHVLRKDYGTLSVSAQGTTGPLEELWFWLVETFADSGVIGLVLLVVGLSRMRRPPNPRGGWFALLATWLLCGPVFIGMLNLEPVGPNAEMIKRFHVLAMIVSTPFVALGAAWALHVELAPKIKAVAAVGAVALLLLTGGVRTSAIYGGALEDSLRNTLLTLPPDAVILGQGGHRYFGWQYLQAVEHVRSDIVTIEPSALGYVWYVDRVRARLGLAIPYPGDRIELRNVLRMLLDETQRPVFVTKDFAPDILKEFRMVPDGPAWRLLRPDEPEPPAEQIFERTRRAFEKFQHRGSPPEYVLDPWGWSLFHAHTEIWEEVVARCEIQAAACAEQARAMLVRYPDL